MGNDGDDGKGKKVAKPAQQVQGIDEERLATIVSEQVLSAMEGFAPVLTKHVFDTLKARKNKKRSLKKKATPPVKLPRAAGKAQAEKPKGKKKRAAPTPDPDDEPSSSSDDDENDSDCDEPDSSSDESEGEAGPSGTAGKEAHAAVPEIPGYGRSRAPRGFGDRPVYEILPNLDSYSEGLSKARKLKALSGLVGLERVADYLNYLEKLIKQVHETSSLMALSSWAVVAGNKDPTKDKPIPLAQTKAGTYKDLTAAKDSIIEMIKDRALMSSESRKKRADKRYMPMVLTQRTIEFIITAGRFSCSFDASAWAQLSQGDTSLEEHKDSLTRMLNSDRKEKLSVRWTYNFLSTMRDLMFDAVERAIDKGNEQNKMIKKAQNASSGGASELAKATALLASALTDGKGVQKRAKPPKGKEALEDEARAAFSHNSNPAQEAAAAAAQNAGKGKGNKTREKLESMPEDKELRKKILRDTVCKFYWEPNMNCTRQNCRFLHIGPDETRSLGIDDAEVKAAVH